MNFLMACKVLQFSQKLTSRDLLDVLRRRVFWPSMAQDIPKWLRNCPECQLHSNDNRNRPQEPLHPLAIVPPFYRWGLDFIGILPPSVNGNRHILVAIDHSTKWPVVQAVKNCDAKTVAEFLLKSIVLPFGVLSEIVSDRGPAFTESTLREYLNSMQVKHLLTSSYHPRTNGVTERFNGLLSKMIHKYLSVEPRGNWENYLDTALLACRIRAHRATGFSPFFLVYGQQPRMPGDELLPSMSDLDEIDLVGERLSQLEILQRKRKEAQKSLEKQRESMKIEYSKKLIKKTTIKEFDLVLIRNEARLKFEPRWLGPLRIRSKHPNGTYSLETLAGIPHATKVHHDRLRKVNGELQAGFRITTKKLENKPWRNIKKREVYLEDN